MIGQQTKTVSRVGKVITDPQPQFVSLVNHGANQTPFKVVKSEHIMTKQKKAEAGDTPALQRIELSKSQFETEDSAIAYLAEHGYEGTLSSTEDSWVAVAKEEGEFDSLDSIDNEDGTVRFVGVLKQEEEVPEGETQTKAEESDEPEEVPTEDEAPEGETEESPEGEETTEKEESPEGEGEQAEETTTDEPDDLQKQVLAKYDKWDATYSNETSIAGVLEDAQWDEPFPSFHAICHAMGVALRNKLADGDTAGAGEVLSEFSTLANGLITQFSKLQKADEMPDFLQQLLLVKEEKPAATEETPPENKTVIIKQERDEAVYEKLGKLEDAVNKLSEANTELAAENKTVRKELDLLMKSPKGSNQLDGETTDGTVNKRKTTASDDVSQIALNGVFGIQSKSL